MEVDGTKLRDSPRKTSWDGVKEDMKRFGLSWQIWYSMVIVDFSVPLDAL